MRTTLEIPDNLIEQAQKELGFKSKTDVVIYSLRELLRKKRIEELKEMSGKITLDIDIPKSRRRPLNRKKK
jgi:Arc/MetJ family transcription regulator